MADTTTELEVLDQIVDVLGGQSGQYETVVPTLQQIRDLLGGGGGGGSYNPSLSVGRADALTGADDTSQWATRESTGSGAATVRSVQGAAVGWNQLVPLLNDRVWQTGSNVVVTADAEQNSVTITSTNDATGTKVYRLPDRFNPPAGHVFYVACEVETNADYNATFGIYTTSGVIAAGINVAGGTPKGRFSTIATIATATSVGYIGLRLHNSTPSDLGATFNGFEIIDLTQMFGSGNEPSTVAEFEAMYPEAYYPYSAPTLKPVQIAGIRSTTAQGGELDSVEIPASTYFPDGMWGAGSFADELTSDTAITRMAKIVLDGSENITWTAKPSQVTEGLYIFYVSDSIWEDYWHFPAVNHSDLTAVKCDKLPTLAGNVYQQWATPAVGVYHTLGAAVLIAPAVGVSTSAQFNAWLTQNPLTICYALATPTTTPISPTLPMTYKVQQGGTESIVVPDGEISAAPVLTIAEGESAADVVMDALACIATPDGPTATANHAINTYLTMGGKLYKVTRVIAVGETIAEGTNVSETTVMAELLALTV